MPRQDSKSRSSESQWSQTIRRRLRRLRDPQGIVHQLRTRPRPEAEYRSRIHRDETASNLLESLALQHDGQGFTKSWHYLDFYNRRLGALAEQSRNRSLPQPLRILEIGVWQGGSLSLWREFFGDSAVIFGVDISEECAHLPNLAGQVRIGSQNDARFLRDVVQEMGGVDIVIDDGSHRCRDVITSFTTLFPLLNEGGLYFIEDLHTSYWPQWQGGLRRRVSSIEFLKDLIDVVNADYFYASPFRREALANAREVASVEFVDSVALISKKTHTPSEIFYGGTHAPEYLAQWDSLDCDFPGRRST